MMKRFGAVATLGAPLLCLAVAGCYDAPVATPNPQTTQATPVKVPQNLKNEVDVLFMVDNSPSMSAMQSELQAKFGQFFTVFQSLAAAGTYADLHVGVVTSDYGAGNVTNATCQSSPGGQKGLLQAVGVAAAPGCMGPMGKPYIEYAFNAGGSVNNLPPGQNLVQTFTCMASVGVQGCGFEHQLESVYAGLQNSIAGQENKGFLRDGALLTVVFVTNEDDASAPPDTDIFDPSKTAQYGAYDTYRQTRFGVACGSPLMLTPYDQSGGPLTGCQGAPNNMSMMIGNEFDISRYINFFARPAAAGGVKADPDDVILVGIDPPETPFQTIIVQSGSGTGTGTNPRYVPCSPAVVNPPTCLVRLDHSCQNNAQPAFFGDPPVRLNTVIRSVKYNQTTNICGADLNAPPDYTQALQSLAGLISSAINPGCVPAPFADLNNPDCVVLDVQRKADGSISSTNIPRCDQAAGAFPCWRLEMKAQCAAPKSPQSVGVTVDRGPGGVAPPNTRAQVQCTTVAGGDGGA